MGFGEFSPDTPISTLSGGQKTRLALARILLQAPDLLMARNGNSPPSVKLHTQRISTNWLNATSNSNIRREVSIHVRRTVHSGPMVASGDSLLDKSLLAGADYAIAPCHGEIFAEQQAGLVKLEYPFTQRSGVFAGDEILQYVQKIYNNLTAVGVGRNE